VNTRFQAPIVNLRSIPCRGASNSPLSPRQCGTPETSITR
jgi:hypothetical protein